MQFVKMQAAGNDYLYFDVTQTALTLSKEKIIQLSSPHFGVGSDGIIFIGKSDLADFSMRIFNADGSEAQMCGNGIRCVGKYVYERKLTPKRKITVETLAGIKTLVLSVDSKDHVQKISVSMGIPSFFAKEIPYAPQALLSLEQQLLKDFHIEKLYPVSMGNPHCIVMVSDFTDFPIHKIGPFIERNRAFPERTNVEFVKIINRGKLQLRIWERGSGETLACGTGACAAAVVSGKVGKTDACCAVEMPGGAVRVVWEPTTKQVFLQGTAEFVFDGILPDI